MIAEQMSFDTQYECYKQLIEQSLPGFLGDQPAMAGGRVSEAARYSLMAGGKRIRPVLMLAVADLLGGPGERVLPFACALEMIHTYSLIHDDLPCMDDDDLRRGRPTCHVVYGEAMAVLAGDHLLNRAFEVMLAAVDPDFPETLEAARLIGKSAGSQGMIGGQVLDTDAGHSALALEALEQLHLMKTGAILTAAAEAGAVLSRADEQDRRRIRSYGRSVGLAFQIRDDMLDVTETAQTLGKTAGKDSRDSKSTYVTLLGLDEAEKRLQQTSDQAMQALSDLAARGRDIAFLAALTHYLLGRKN